MLLLAAGLAWLSPVQSRAEGPENAASTEPDDGLIRIMPSPDGKTLFLLGRITVGSYLKFKRVAAVAPNATTLFLASGGGSVRDGFLISTIVRERKMRTWVGAFCASSCTQIFLAGTDRAAAPGAEIGFHESWRYDRDGFAIGSQSDESELDTLMQANFIRAGVDQAFMKKALSTAYDDMWYPDHDEMAKARVLTRRATLAEIAPPLASGLGTKAIGDILAKRPLWQRLREAEPKFFEKTLESLWREGQTGVDPVLFEVLAQFEAWVFLNANMAMAPDAQVEEMLSLAREQAGAGQGISIWNCANFGFVAGSPLSQALLQREQTMLLDIYNTKPGKALSWGKANRMLAALRKGSLAEPLRLQRTGETPADRCKAITAILDDLAARPPKERIKLTRALLTTGDIMPDPFGS